MSLQVSKVVLFNLGCIEEQVYSTLVGLVCVYMNTVDCGIAEMREDWYHGMHGGTEDAVLVAEGFMHDA